MEVRSGNICAVQKSTSITYSLCVCVCVCVNVAIQHAMCKRHIVMWPISINHAFTLPHKQQDFRKKKKITEHKTSA